MKNPKYCMLNNIVFIADKKKYILLRKLFNK